MIRLNVRTVASMALLVAAAAADAADQVDLQVRLKDRVTGTLYPKDARETFLVDVPRGARITARAWRSGKRDSAPTLSLRDAAGAVAPGTPDSTGARLKSYTTEKSDQFGLRVESDGAFDGEYQFTVAVAPQRSWSQKTGADVAPGGEATFAFAAPAGASVDVALSPAKKSPFVPRIVQIDGPDGYVAAVDGADATPRVHRIRGVLLGAGGEYSVRVRNDGAAAGAFAVSVRVVPERVAKSATIDIRDASLTNSLFDGDALVYGRVVDSRGAVVGPDAAGTPLAGAVVTVPANSVPSPVVFAIQSGEDISDSFRATNGAGLTASGPAVKFLPEGTLFDPPVMVTIPYNPDGYDDPASEVNVATEDPVTHLPVEVPRSDLVIDTVAHTVTFPAAHFSRFQGTTPRPRAVRGTFVQLDMGGRVLAGGGRATLSLSLTRGLAGPRSGNGFTRTLPRRSIVFSPTAVGWNDVDPAPGGTVTVVDDENITLTDPVDGAVQYVRGRNPDVFIRRAPPDVDAATVSVLLHRTKGAPTPSNVAGNWNAFVLEASAQHFDTGVNAFRGLNLTMAAQVLELSFGLDGKTWARSSAKFAAVPDEKADRDGIGRWFVVPTVGSALPPSGTLDFPDDGSNTVRLTMPLGLRSKVAATVVLYPVLRGDMLVGVADNFDAGVGQGPLQRLVVLARSRADKTKLPLLVGDSVFTAFGLGAVDFAGPPANQDFGFVVDDLVATHDDDWAVSYVGRRDTYLRDALGAPSYVTNPAFTATGTYAVDLDGVYRVKNALLLGAVGPRPNVFVAARFVPGSLAVGFGVLKRPTQ